MSSDLITGLLDPSSFYSNIDKIVEEFNVTYIEAVVFYCDKNNIEIETAASLIKSNFRMKSNLQGEGEKLKFLSKGAQLPL